MRRQRSAANSRWTIDLQPVTKHDDPLHSRSRALQAFVEEAPLERRPILEFLSRAAESLPANSRVLDVGAGSAPYRELFEHTEYRTLDRVSSVHRDRVGFDIEAEAEAIPLEDGCIDIVVCTQVLEHLPQPLKALCEFHRVLASEGRLFLTAPLVWEEHEAPFDFYRYTRSGLDELLSQAGFEKIEIAARGNCFETLAQLLRNARWSLSLTSDPDEQAAFARLEELSDELLRMSALDARKAFPLGYQVSATRPITSKRTNENTAERRTEQERQPILYLAPWVDLGGSDKGTIDWFKCIDQDRWAPSIITTQPSANRWLPEIESYADEIWPLPDLMAGSEFPRFILEFIATRKVKVIHIMNSRLGFDLLPDITCLPSKPVVVVQHHAEEADRSGYVRYVASRYGNLVDGFSVTSQQLARAMLDYDIAQSRMHVITTGVDAASEFNPDKVLPFDDLGGSGLRILWPGRFAEQKDPMLTLEIVYALDKRGLEFTLHFVGDGELRDEMLNRITELGIADRIRWHPPSHEMPRWYRSCDLLLMTSTFEGVPYVIYESMAMGVPVVAPALPGNVELMADGGGVLIDPRDDVTQYANSIEKLIHDKTARMQIGQRARSRALEEHSLSSMVEQHETLYEYLLSHRREREATRNNSHQTPEEGTCSPSESTSLVFPRQPVPPRTVAVIVPCYQHGRFLPDAIRSLHEQTLRPTRIVVVDDASEDSETRQALDVLDHDPLVTVIRMAHNRGPSVARNRALAEVSESYVLPLDADDMLPPRALETMVSQLERAPETIGFIYPNVQHFGNRNDYYLAPAYNLDALLDANFCAASALFDRRIFDNGIRYAEDIVHGHEDWEFVLQLAEHWVYGEPASGPTLLYRKQGFSRINAAEYGSQDFLEQIRERHIALYCDRRDEIKAQWAPALSLLLVGGCDGSSGSWPTSVPEWLRRQTCGDFEVLRAGRHNSDVDVGCAVQHPEGVHPAVSQSVRAARGRFVVLLGTSASEALRATTFVEQIVRLLLGSQNLDRLVLAPVADRRMPRLAPLGHKDAALAIPCGLAWRRDLECDGEIVELGAHDTPLEDILLQWQTRTALSWRAV